MGTDKSEVIEATAKAKQRILVKFDVSIPRDFIEDVRRLIKDGRLELELLAA
jgi:hypothetical protein